MGLQRLDHQIRDLGISYIQHLVPFNSLAGEVAPRGKSRFSGATRIRDPHGAARQGVTKMAGVKMALVAHARRENASENADVGVGLQQLTHRLSLPARLNGVG